MALRAGGVACCARVGVAAAARDAGHNARGLGDGERVNWGVRRLPETLHTPKNLTQTAALKIHLAGYLMRAQGLDDGQHSIPLKTMSQQVGSGRTWTKSEISLL